MVRNLLLLSTAALLPASAAHSQAKPISRGDFVKTVDGRFNAMDTNHDGSVGKQEMTAELQREMGQANARIAQQLEAKFRQLDTNKDGQLSLREFMAAQPSLRASENPDQMMQRLDTNHDGKLTADEFRNPEMAKFNRADLNHDGVVTPDEARRAAGQK